MFFCTIIISQDFCLTQWRNYLDTACYSNKSKQKNQKASEALPLVNVSLSPKDRLS